MEEKEKIHDYYGHKIVLDHEDVELLYNYRWIVENHGNRQYLATKIGNTTVRFHRLVISAKPGQIVDHINSNGLDNRRSNLRIVSSSQNVQGRITKKKWSDYRGVSFNYWRKTWTSQIMKDGKSYWLGAYKCQRAAALAYDDKADELYGPNAKKNFNNFVCLDTAKMWISNSRCRIFSALYKKRTNGAYREILAHTLSKKMREKIRFNPDEKNLVPVRDFFTNEFRFISLEGLKLLTIEGQTWRIF